MARATQTRTRTIALVGARGHTGAEMLRLLAGHPSFELAAATSRELAGQRVRDHVEAPIETDVVFEPLSPAEVAQRNCDVVILGLPNRESQPYVEAIDSTSPASIIVDLSADHRFDDDWVYGLPELDRSSIRGATRIANPGCYATGMLLALNPVRDLLSGPPHVFGISGYSGAGTTRSDRNDPEKLRDNIMPYSLIGHTHEREASRYLGRPVHFHPHVAPYFRGITLTISMPLNSDQSIDPLAARYLAAYESEPLVRFQTETPLVRDIAGKHHCAIGGMTVDEETGRRAVVVVVLDNLLKGAATQALQNMNLACGFDEFAGIL